YRAHGAPMGYDQSFLDELKARVRISEVAARKVELTRRGSEYVGQGFTCDDTTGSWSDFSAGRGGDIFAFLEFAEGRSREEAIAICAELAGIPLPNGNGSTNGGNNGGDRANGNGSYSSDAPPLDEDLAPERALLGLLLARQELLNDAEEDVTARDFI